MTLQAAIDAELGFLQAEAEARMTSRATVWREDPDAPPALVDGLEVPAFVAEQTNLPGRMVASRGAGQTRTVSIGQTEVQLAVREWHCPVATTGLRDGDVLEITVGRVGTFLRVLEATGADQTTALRLPVVEIQKPEGIL